MKKWLALSLALVLVLSSVVMAVAEEVKPVILVVSFGTSYNDTRAVTIDAIEAEIAKAYPDYEVRRAFTAQIVIDILAEREKLVIDNVTQAMDRLVADGVKDVIVQPTHVINGFEYNDILAEVEPYADKFDSFKVGHPLLTHYEDYEVAINTLMENEEFAASDETALVFMGHGTHHYANATYSQLQLMFHFAGYDNVFFAGAEGFPTIDNVVAELTAGGYKKAVLTPFMIVAGDHATNDMASDEEGSWNTILTNAGFEVTSRMIGLGQRPGIQKLIIEHLSELITK